MKFTLIYDGKEEPLVMESILQELKDIISDHHPFDLEKSQNIALKTRLLLYLSDTQIKELLAILPLDEYEFAALPHPDAKNFCAICGVPSKLEKAIKHLYSNPSPLKVDLLYCNQNPIFNHLVVGAAAVIATNHISGHSSLWLRARYIIRNLLKLKPFKLEITQQNGNIFKTAVSGIVIVPHRTKSILSHFIPGESNFNDGKLNALLISPRSVLGVLYFTIRSIFKRNNLPDFGAQIKTDRISFSGSGEDLTYTSDGNIHTSPVLDLELKKKHLTIIPGQNLEIPEEGVTAKEIFKVQALPSGEAASELATSSLPIIRRASTEEFKDLFQVLRDNAQTKNSYMVLMAISAFLATLGLFADSSPVIIGAMILAPLMAPLISLSMAVLRLEKNLMISSSKTILAGIGISFVFAVVVTWITPIRIANSEILDRISPNILDLGIAVLSGIAGAYAHAREEVAKTLAGVAIAVALVPPLVVAGIGFGWLDWNIFSGASLLFFTNLSGMVLAGSLTFMALGFSPFRLARKGIFVTFIIVIIFSLPLGFSFNTLLQEHRLIMALDAWETDNVTIRDVKIQNMKPLKLSIKVVTEYALLDYELNDIKAQIEEKLDQEVALEINIAIKK